MGSTVPKGTAEGFRWKQNDPEQPENHGKVLIIISCDPCERSARDFNTTKEQNFCGAIDAKIVELRQLFFTKSEGFGPPRGVTPRVLKMHQILKIKVLKNFVDLSNLLRPSITYSALSVEKSTPKKKVRFVSKKFRKFFLIRNDS